MTTAPPRFTFYSDANYEIRPAKNTDEFRDIWWNFMQVLGWNRGYYDLESYVNPSNSGGMILLIEKAKKVTVGHVAAVINSNSTGWISMFIIDEAHRGKGLGRELFKAAMTDAEKHGCKVLGLDGVKEQKATYERRAFVESPLGTVKIMVRPLVAREGLPTSVAYHGPGQLVDVRQVQNLLARHELKYIGFDRPKLWTDKHMFQRPDVSGWALVTKADPQNADDILAWTLIRRCSGGFRIGPLYAQDKESAKAVLMAIINSGIPDAIKKTPLPNEPLSDGTENEIAEKAMLVAEVWGGNKDALAVFGELGWGPVGVEYYRMWFGGQGTPEQSAGGLAQKGVFAIFDAAIG